MEGFEPNQSHYCQGSLVYALMEENKKGDESFYYPLQMLLDKYLSSKQQKNTAKNCIIS